MSKKVVIVGAGGHGKVIADILELNDYEIIGFIYDDPKMKGAQVSGYNVLGSIDDLDSFSEAECGFVAQVDHEKRIKYIQILLSRGLELINAFHPTSVRSKHIKMGKGVCMMAGSIVNPGVTVGDGSIINTSATIDHDSTLGVCSHISPGAKIARNVEIGENSFIGTGAIINPNLKVGNNVIVGSGTVIINDIPDEATAVGNPAQVIKMKGERFTRYSSLY
ncbi:MAG: acetyltransferase [Candidatus Hodarchaeales archaeon]|jgi:sugar O-acyltransferase (sialic acid O-acetyltransferase NeuD family)